MEKRNITYKEKSMLCSYAVLEYISHQDLNLNVSRLSHELKSDSDHQHKFPIE